MRYEIVSNGFTLPVELTEQGGRTILKTDNASYAVELEAIQPGVYSLLLNNRSYLVGVLDREAGHVNVQGRPMQLELLDDIHLRLRDLGWQSASETKAGRVTAQIPTSVSRRPSRSRPQRRVHRPPGAPAPDRRTGCRYR